MAVRTVPLNFRLAVPELEYIVGDCTPKALFTDPDFEATSHTVAAAIGVEHVLTANSDRSDCTYEGAIEGREPLTEILEAAVIGIPDEKWGEAGRAIVVLKEGQTLEESEILEHCRAQLAKFKVPTSVAFTDTLPRNATGKVLKSNLRDTFGAL